MPWYLTSVIRLSNRTEETLDIFRSEVFSIRCERVLSWPIQTWNWKISKFRLNTAAKFVASPTISQSELKYQNEHSKIVQIIPCGVSWNHFFISSTPKSYRGSQESNALINGVKLYFTYQPGNQDKERLNAFNVSVSQYDTLTQKEGDRHQMLWQFQLPLPFIGQNLLPIREWKWIGLFY